MYTIPQILDLCDDIRLLENQAKFDEALRSLEHLWDSEESWPKVEDLDHVSKVRILLRCGRIAGFKGREKDNNQLQSHSRDLLFKAWELASKHSDEELIAEIENQIASSFTRMNEHSEARIWLEASLRRDIPPDCYSRCESHVLFAVVLNQEGRLEEMIEYIDNSYHYLESLGNHFFLGSASANKGIAFNRLERFEAAQQHFEIAAFHHQKSGNRTTQAINSNNLAMLNARMKRFNEAHQHADISINLFKKLNDVSRVGFAWDTKSFIYLQEKKFDKALDAINKCIETLLTNNFVPYLIESYRTKCKILLKLAKTEESYVCFLEASNLIRTYSDEKELHSWIKTFSSLFEEAQGPVLKEIYTEKVIDGKEMRISLPESLTRFAEFDGVWITNDHLQYCGVRKGALALVVDEKPVEGQFGALLKNGEGEVIFGKFGYFDDFVSVQISETVPELLNLKDVEIIGRVIGYVDPDDTKTEVWRARPLT